MHILRRTPERHAPGEARSSQETWQNMWQEAVLAHLQVKAGGEGKAGGRVRSPPFKHFFGPIGFIVVFFLVCAICHGCLSQILDRMKFSFFSNDERCVQTEAKCKAAAPCCLSWACCKPKEPNMHDRQCRSGSLKRVKPDVGKV